MCLARSTPHTGSSGAQGLWSEYTAKPQASRSQRDTGPLGLSEDSGLVSRRGRRCLWFTPEFCEQICRQQQKLAGNRRRRHPKHRPRIQAPKRRPQSSGSAQRIPTPT